MPCNGVHADVGDSGDSIHPECIADRKKQEDYLGNMKVIMLFTDSTFIQDVFDGE